jgi:hypothetical protein
MRAINYIDNAEAAGPSPSVLRVPNAVHVSGAVFTVEMDAGVNHVF